MTLIDVHPERTANPVDEIELLAAQNDWTFERSDEDEIAISIAGDDTDYNVAVTWLSEIEALHVACAFDIKVPAARRNEVTKLLALINEQLWIGHFDIWPHEGVIIFRNSHLLTGGADVTPQQCEALLRSATESCDLYYQAFQFVVWAGKSAAEALEGVMFETVGEA